MNDATQIKKMLEAYQTLNNVHPLTCEKNEAELLKPIIETGRVVLVCTNPTCNFRKEEIPEFFFEEGFQKEFEDLKKVSKMIDDYEL